MGHGIPLGVRTTDAPSRVNAWMGRVDARTATDGRVYETVCTCDPGVHWTRCVEFTLDVAAMPAGGWLGSGADEGRAKLR